VSVNGLKLEDDDRACVRVIYMSKPICEVYFQAASSTVHL